VRLSLLAATIAAAAAVGCGGATAAHEAAGARLPGARATKICAAAGPFWPTMTLALNGKSAWVACKEQSRIIRVRTSTGRTLKSIRLGGPVIAVAAGYWSIWALSSSAILYRVNAKSSKVTKRIALNATAAYNIWIGGGSVWVADDQGASVIRVSPTTNRVTARIPVGDGPADMVFDAASAWVIDHRDRTLVKIDLSTNAPSPLATVPGDAPERMVYAAGRLWITGRGTDLVGIDPQTGAVESTIEIGASGIDVVALGGSVWVPVRGAAVDASGFPTMEALQRVSLATGTVTTIARASGRIDVHGLIARAGEVWLADNRGGFLYRLKAQRLALASKAYGERRERERATRAAIGQRREQDSRSRGAPDGSRSGNQASGGGSRNDRPFLGGSLLALGRGL
jgi:hypothetical protein